MRSGKTEDETKKEEKEEAKEEDKADIKSNNPHLTGGEILSLTKQEGMACNDTRFFLYNTAERFKQRKYPTDVTKYLGVIQNSGTPKKRLTPPPLDTLHRGHLGYPSSR